MKHSMDSVSIDGRSQDGVNGRKRDGGSAHEAIAHAVAAPEAAAQRSRGGGGAGSLTCRAAPEQCNQCAIKWEQRWEDRRASCVRDVTERCCESAGHTCRWRHAHLTHHVLMIWERQCYNIRACKPAAAAAAGHQSMDDLHSIFVILTNAKYSPKYYFYTMNLFPALPIECSKYLV